MTDTTHWVSEPDQETAGTGSAVITIVRPPFTPRPYGAEHHAPHDPARARSFADSFPSIEAVLEELPLSDAGPEYPYHRSDLEQVRVGCWGTVTCIADYSLCSYEHHLLEQTSSLADRYPDAVIVGTCEVDTGESYCEDSIHLPGGLTLHTGGWPDNYELTGDARAIATGAHITEQALDEQNINLDDVPADVPWSSLGRLVLGPYAAWGFGNLATSRFRVRHTSRNTSSMEEVWFLYE